ncbi:TlpA disulfide reductase family protein [Pelagicoccus sp. SDUM812002]|uniref:TlpA family protein disulfide reductase n=1 Tax=Pelagicoccus sp. SDUM812002 TaxID=3041266 RepID=UPI00280FDF29|nr:TlpA disulfide reductase family protein [Pelagicoccus sp. SDUM812002]MDQ8186600.1 TlpA disulfide reductase family protein [Pelagicoccus sp. SDUM812002]
MKNTTIPFLLLVGIVSVIAFQSKPSAASDADAFIGKPGPEFHAQEWISEKPEMEGKYLLVDFWATWCGPCIRAIPHMNELHTEFQDRLTIVGLSNESRQKVESMKSPEMEYYSALDPSSRMAGFFEIRSIPHVVLMDPEGIVVYKGHPAYLTTSKVEELLSSN